MTIEEFTDEITRETGISAASGFAYEGTQGDVHFFININCQLIEIDHYPAARHSWHFRVGTDLLYTGETLRATVDACARLLFARIRLDALMLAAIGRPMAAPTSTP